MSDAATPGCRFVVRIIDLSSPSEDKTVEEIPGFPTLEQANAFVRAYVRDSVERCRVPGAAGRDVLSAWFAFGEDAHVAEAGEQGWQSAKELDWFAARPAPDGERDWRALDPRPARDEDGID